MLLVVGRMLGAIADLPGQGSSFDDFRKAWSAMSATPTSQSSKGTRQAGSGSESFPRGSAEAVLRDERAVLPIGVYNAKYGVTLSLPSVVGREGVGNRILRTGDVDEERRSPEPRAPRSFAKRCSGQHEIP